MSVMLSQKWRCGFILHRGTATCFQEPAVRNIYATGKELDISIMVFLFLFFFFLVGKSEIV